MNQDFIYMRETQRSFQEAKDRVEEMAVQENFRVLHVHDVQATLGEKGFSIEPTVILEVCSALLAFKVLGLDKRAALLIPCRIVVEERGGEVTVATLLPQPLEGNPTMETLAKQMGDKLKHIVDQSV